MINLPEDTPVQDAFYNFHKSMGALTMGLLTWRIFILLQVWWRKYTRRLPTLTNEWMKKFALHTVLYLFMLAVPLSGFFLSNSYQSGNVPFFGIRLPDIFPENQAMVELARNLHFWLTYTFLVFIALHGIDQWKVVRATWRRIVSAIRGKSVSRGG